MSNFDEPQDPTDIRYYGGTETIHSGGEVNVELNENGDVIAVWFRCQPLRFTQTTVEDERDRDMRNMYEEGFIPAIDALVLRD